MSSEWIQIILVNKPEGSCRFLSVQEALLKKLIHVRGNVYQDDSHLKIIDTLPASKIEPEITISPEMRARAEESWQLHCMTRDAGTRAAASTLEPQPMSFEEQLTHDWRFNPGIRQEFTNFGSYQAFMRADKAGRTRVCGMS